MRSRDVSLSLENVFLKRLSIVCFCRAFSYDAVYNEQADSSWKNEGLFIGFLLLSTTSSFGSWNTQLALSAVTCQFSFWLTQVFYKI